jgi:hypothetical protein
MMVIGLYNTTNDLSGNSYNVQSGTVFNGKKRKLLLSMEVQIIFNIVMVLLNQAISFFSYSMWVKPSSLSGIQTILRREAPSMVLLFG